MANITDLINPDSWHVNEILVKHISDHFELIV